MLKLIQPAKMRREHAPDRPRIRRVVSVSADVAIHRARIQARAAANAMKHLALLGIGEQVCTAVIQQDHVKLFRPRALARAARPPHKRVVHGNRLPGAGAREHRPKKREVLQPRNYFFDSGNYHVNLRQRHAKIGVALVRGNRDQAQIGHQKIRARNSHLRAEKRATQRHPRRRDEFHRIVGIDSTQLLLE